MRETFAQPSVSKAWDYFIHEWYKQQQYCFNDSERHNGLVNFVTMLHGLIRQWINMRSNVDQALYILSISYDLFYSFCLQRNKSFWYILNQRKIFEGIEISRFAFCLWNATTKLNWCTHKILFAQGDVINSPQICGFFLLHLTYLQWMIPLRRKFIS